MSNDNKPRDIIHELADVLALLGDDFTMTGVECDPGDSAVRVIKRNSEKTMYVIAYSNPADTEMRLYDGTGSLITYHAFYNGAMDEFTTEDIADYVARSL